MSQKKEPEKKYPAKSLLKSKAFKEYQQDFAAVILGNGEYTVSEAKKLLDAKLKGVKS